MSCEGSSLQNGGLTLLLISLPADSTTVLLMAKIMNAVETGKKILISPDVDAYDYWKEKYKARPKLEIYISDYLQKSARLDVTRCD